MAFLTALWIPILASAAACWFASALFWMAVQHHSKDTKPIPNEQEFIDAVRRMNIPPGSYGFPDFQKCKGLSKEEKAKMYDSRPMGLLTLWGDMNMGVNMLLTVLFFLITSTILAYLGWATLKHTAESFSHIMQVIGTAGILAYCFASIPNDIWFQRSRRAMLMCFIDGIVFALITATIFAYLWPK